MPVARDLGLFALLAVATLFPAWQAPGWPDNHEATHFVVRTEIYARHFSWLDVMPIWSGIDLGGYSSPQPLFYHKLFYLLSGPLALLLPVKTAIVVVLAGTLVAGAFGVQQTMRRLGASELASTVAGCSLVTANYTVTDWLIRGAMAELSGAMLIPWVFYAFLKTIEQRRITVGLAVALASVWLGHSVMAFYVVILLGVAFAVLMIVGEAPTAVLHPRTAWPALAVFVLLVAPYLVPMASLIGGYDFSRILSPPYKPGYQFVPALSYVWDSKWHFGETYRGITTQLDLAMLGLVFVGMAMLARNRGWRWGLVTDALRPLFPFIIVLTVALSLQLSVTRAFYDFVPGAAYLQFPWRLLAVITPTLIIIAFYVADKELHVWRPRVIVAAGVVMVITCGAFRPIQYSRISMNEPIDGLNFGALGEYEPADAMPLAETRVQLPVRWQAAGCSLAPIDPPNQESPVRRFRTTCLSPALLPLPLYTSPIHSVETTPGSPRPCQPVPGLPGICGADIPAGESTVSVRLPNMARFVRWMWRGR